MRKTPRSVLALTAVLFLCFACSPPSSTAKSPSSNQTATSTPATAAPSANKTAATTKPAPPTPPTITNLPIIRQFSGEPAIITDGGISSLKWEISNATAVSISPAVGAVTASGSKPVSPSTSTAYTLTASNAQGAITAVVTVMVEKPHSTLLPVVLSLSINPRMISENDTSKLSWDVYGADYVSLGMNPLTGSTITTISSQLTKVGTMNLSPAYTLTAAQLRVPNTTPIMPSTATYTLTAANVSGNTTATFDITVMRTAIIPKPGIPIAQDNMTVVAASVVPMIGWFAAEPFTVVQGNRATLSWEVNQATKVLLNNVEVSAYGSQEISPASSANYTLTASNQYWTVSKAVTVLVVGYKPEWFKPVVH